MPTTAKRSRTRTGGPVQRWFPVAAYGTYVYEGSWRRWRPADMVHAKQIGTQRTACGIYRTYWQTFWDMPLPRPGDGGWCSDCAALGVAAPA